MRKKTINLNPNDQALLAFLWRWKVATTATIGRAIYPNVKIATTYRRLMLLAYTGFIEGKSDLTSRCHLWTLGRLGFDRLLRYLPELREAGYRSENLAHDLISSAAHLGEFLIHAPPEVALFSEQELRRFDTQFYPSWVPKSDRHRPDGYWYVPIGSPMAVAALEVELSLKDHVRYKAVADFYASEPSILRVLWITRTASMARGIQRTIIKQLRDRLSPHDFVSYPEFKSLGWNARIELGPDAGRPIANIVGNKAATSSQPVAAKLLLDVRKSPHKSKTCRIFDPGEFPY